MPENKPLTIPALSLWRPWAGLLFNGKDVENRSWKTHHRGPLLIHAAAKRFDYDGLDPAIELLTRHRGFNPTPQNRGHITRVMTDTMPECWTQGKIIGAVYLAGCKHYDDVEPGKRSLWHFPDMYGWMMVGKPYLFPTPIAYRGRQRLFSVPVDILSWQFQNTLLAWKAMSRPVDPKEWAHIDQVCRKYCDPNPNPCKPEDLYEPRIP